MNEFLFRTKIRINSENLNLSQFIQQNLVSSKSYIEPPSFENKILDPNSIIYLDSFILVFVVKNELDLFSVKNYLDFMNHSKFTIYVKLDSKFDKIGRSLYTNIYTKILDKEIKITYSNFLIKKIDLNHMENDTLYYYHHDFSPRYNSLCTSKNYSKKIKINIETFEYQTFNSNMIFWFLDKIFNNLHKYIHSGKNIVLCTKNLTPNHLFHYIYLYPNTLDKLKFFFNWFMMSNKTNIMFDEFIVFIFGYYFLNLNFRGNIFYNFYMDYETDESVSFYMNNKFSGIRMNLIQMIPFQEFKIKFKHSLANITSIFHVHSSFQSIVLINNYSGTLEDNIYYVLGIQIEWTESNILSFIMNQSFSHIFVFQSIEDYDLCKKYLRFLPTLDLKLNYSNTSFYSLTKHSDHMKNIIRDKLENYVICFNDTNLNGIEYEKYVLQNLKANRILFTFLIDDKSLILKFLDFYSNYQICFINIFNISVDISNIIVISYFDKLLSTIQENYFVYPNYFYDNLDYFIFKTHLVPTIDFKSSKTFDYLSLFRFNNVNHSSLGTLFIVDYPYTFHQKIKLYNHHL